MSGRGAIITTRVDVTPALEQEIDLLGRRTAGWSAGRSA
jgi:hypothetical protein